MHHSRGASRVGRGSLLFVLMAACAAPAWSGVAAPLVSGSDALSTVAQPSVPAPSAPKKRYPGYTEGALPPVLKDPLQGIANKALDYKPPKIERVTLKNGILVYLVEDHELPLIDMAVLVGAGEIHTPAGKEGLADLASAAWRSGGTKTRPGDALDKELEDRAAGLSVGIGPEASSVRMSLMARDLAWGVSVLADVTTAPAFPQSAIDLERPRIEEEISRQDDDPGQIAFRLLDEKFYGKTNPWGRKPSLESLATVTRKDLADFYAVAFHPKRTRIVVSGDFQKSEVVPLLEKSFGKWSPSFKTLPSVAAPEVLKKTEVIYVEMPLPQTTFILAMPSVGRNHPDQEILSVFNDILGGSGFDSLLMEEIRSNRGLAYGVSSDLDNAGEAAGMLSIVGQTKAGSTVESIGLAMKILESLRSGPPVRASDLERAKNSTLNSFVFRYVSPFSVALQEATFEMFGFPKDYLANLPGQVEKISAADLSAAATRDIDTSKMLLIVVGFAGRFDRPLESLGLGKPVELPAPNRGFLVTP